MIWMLTNAIATAQTSKALAWLSAPDPSVHYKWALNRCRRGSCHWFLLSEAFYKWSTQQTSVLWLKITEDGDETTLSSAIIEELGKTSSTRDVLYFYFGFQDLGGSSFESMVASLVSQLYRERKDSQEPLDSLHLTVEGEQKPSIDNLCAIFSRMIQLVGEIWIVLDAINECRTKKESQTQKLISWLTPFLNLRQPKIHLLITSDSLPSTNDVIHKWACAKDIVDVKDDSVSKDIREHVHARVRRQANLKEWWSRKDIQDEIENALMERANEK
jgi:hypothetical protein